MEILIGALISLITEIYKKISEKLGVNNAKIVFLGIPFVLVVAYTFLLKNGVVNETIIQNMVETFAVSVATYEVLFKRFINPIIAKIQGK